MPEGLRLWNFQPYRFIEVSPVAGAMGAEIGGVDLADSPDDEVFREIYQALLEYQAIFFREQELTPEQYLAFAKRWGGIHLHPFMKGMDDHPEILELIKTEKDTRAFGNAWHSDQMFSPIPAKATMLYAHETPDAGGDTLYASLYSAYDALSDGMKAMLGNLRAFNAGDKMKVNGGQSRRERYAGVLNETMKVVDPVDVQTESLHPVIRTHPETGRKALYIGAHTQHLADMTDEESAPLMDMLMRHIRKPEFTCRFRWRPGSLAIWDNRCCQHYAINDYAGKRRRMHRITIAGEEAPF